jgi:ubiquitin-conjugating enzyme E2 M
VVDYTDTSQIWSMKKNEDAAAKKKPKTSAAQIRVQKGAPG